MSTYVITYNSRITGKRQLYKTHYTKRVQAKNRLVRMWEEPYFKNPRIKKII